MDEILNKGIKSKGISKPIFALSILGLIGITYGFVKIYLPPCRDEICARAMVL